jgi:L-threonylcarbamoyladenylate synthase
MREQIESLIGAVDVFTGSIEPTHAACSPGQQEKHYSPLTAALGFEVHQRNPLAAELMTLEPHSAVVMTIGAGFSTAIETIEMPTDPAAYAAQMYATLRRLDAGGYSAIYIELPPPTPRWLAVRDRLARATRPI